MAAQFNSALAKGNYTVPALPETLTPLFDKKMLDEAAKPYIFSKYISKDTPADAKAAMFGYLTEGDPKTAALVKHYGGDKGPDSGDQLAIHKFQLEQQQKQGLQNALSNYSRYRSDAPPGTPESEIFKGFMQSDANSAAILGGNPDFFKQLSQDPGSESYAKARGQIRGEVAGANELAGMGGASGLTRQDIIGKDVELPGGGSLPEKYAGKNIGKPDEYINFLIQNKPELATALGFKENNSWASYIPQFLGGAADNNIDPRFGAKSDLTKDQLRVLELVKTNSPYLTPQAFIDKLQGGIRNPKEWDPGNIEDAEKIFEETAKNRLQVR